MLGTPEHLLVIISSLTALGVQHLEIRLLTDDDISSFWALRLRALSDSPEAFGSSYEESAQDPIEEVAQRFRTRTVAGDNFVVGAFEGGPDRIVGTVGFYREEGIKSRHKGLIWGVFVVPEARGKGVARALIEEALRIASEQEGLEQIHLAVGTENRDARNLYRAVGFEVYGVEPHALRVGGRYIDEELMVLHLAQHRPETGPTVQSPKSQVQGSG
jgi:RimJ/RimL family protein N-acetyltransferase